MGIDLSGLVYLAVIGIAVLLGSAVTGFACLVLWPLGLLSIPVAASIFGAVTVVGGVAVALAPR